MNLAEVMAAVLGMFSPFLSSMKEVDVTVVYEGIKKLDPRSHASGKIFNGLLASSAYFIVTSTIYYMWMKNTFPYFLEKWMGRVFFYPTLPFVLLRYWFLEKKTTYMWFSDLDERVLLGAIPLRSHVSMLSSRGVTAVVNVMDEYSGPVDEYQKYGIEQLRIPIVDHTEPSVEEYELGTQFIQRKLEDNSGNKVLIHCKGGHGRSAAMAFCHLLRSGKTASLEETQEYINRRRNVRKGLYKQRYIISFWQSLKNANIGC